MKGYVYLLFEVDPVGNERHKIGFSKNHPDKRVKQLQTGSSNKISTLNYYESANYKKIEGLLHKKFLSKKTETKNEWFNLTDEDIKNFTKYCEKYDKDIQFIQQNNSLYFKN
jgi:hypothetical protein